jgi:hypothetical protein
MDTFRACVTPTPEKERSCFAVVFMYQKKGAGSTCHGLIFEHFSLLSKTTNHEKSFT